MAEETAKESFPYIVFGLPIVLAVIITWLKYFVGSNFESKVIADMLIDVCVDVLTVGAAILIAYSGSIGTPSCIFWLSVALVIVLLFNITIRRLNMMGKLSENKTFCLICGIASCAGVMTWLFLNVC